MTMTDTEKSNLFLNAWKGGKLKPELFSSIYGPLARDARIKTGIPASVILAQAALETGWGKETCGTARNLFGIKGTGNAGSVEVMTHEFYDGERVTVKKKFAAYKTWQDSIEAHSRLLTQNKRYASCFEHKDDPEEFARELQKCGYATSPTYAQKLIALINQTSSNFKRWDCVDF